MKFVSFKSIKSTFFSGLFLLTAVNTNAQDPVSTVPKADSSTFSVGAQIRPRFEYRNGFKKPLESSLKSASFVEQRSRIWFDFKNSKFHVHVNVQDIRMWGSTNQIYKSDPSMFNAYEAYGEYFINKNWGFKVGRQAIDYDNARFFGNLDWAAQGRSHDAFLLKYNNKAKKIEVHAGVAFNQAQTEPTYLSYTQYPNAGNYKMMYYLWAHKEWDKFSGSFVFNNDARENMADTSLFNRQTLGLIPTYTAGKWKFDGEFYYQMGKNPGNQDVSAFFVSINATVKTKITPVTIGFDYASGTAHDADSTVDNAWNPLYGTNHKFYGYMDYFYVGNGHGQLGRTSGLIDIYAKTNFQLGKSKKHFLKAHLHYFMSPVELRDLTSIDPSATVSTGLGTEIDLVYTLKLTKGVSANVGYSQMFATDSMKQIKQMASPAGYAETGINNWAWVQINFNTDLFSFKK